MKAVIIDDEKKARILLKTLLVENCPEITQIHQATDLISGVESIKFHQPDVVFLDIEMPEHSGLEILKFFEKDQIQFKIIFTTAYSEYAVKAFELSAIDYLLKPLRPSSIINSVKKITNNHDISNIDQKLQELKQSLRKNEFKKIALPISDGVQFVDFEEIVMLEADGMYTKITTTSLPEILVSKPLKHFSSLLENLHYFYRPHRSYLINLQYIKQYIKSDGGYIVMKNDKKVSISKEKRAQFLELVGQI